MSSILIVDNEERFCKVIKAAMNLDQLNAAYRTSGQAALEYLQNYSVDIVITDLKMDKMDGLQLLDEVKSLFPHIEIMMMTAYATQKTAVDALKKGAYDYLIKPFEMDELILKVRRILEQQQILQENKHLQHSCEKPVFFQKIIGRSKKMQAIYRLIKKGSKNEATVLIRGASGTGKELVANAIHEESRRADAPFITVNCAALPENLLESELFGYEKGAFTGANQRHVGKFEQASGGSIFLDEIGDMSLSIQAKLLRVLQNKEIYRLGGSAKIVADVRIIAATHQDLEQMVEEGTFRKDLYYRLNVFPIFLPPLCERKEDLPALIHHFIDLYSIKAISREALALLMDYNWPGNIRELQNAVERAAIISESIVNVEDLPANLTIKHETISQEPQEYQLPEEGIQLDEFEKQLILQAIQKAGGNKTRAAELLGITRRRLYSMMERFAIDHQQ